MIFTRWGMSSSFAYRSLVRGTNGFETTIATLERWQSLVFLFLNISIPQRCCQEARNAATTAINMHSGILLRLCISTAAYIRSLLNLPATLEILIRPESVILSNCGSIDAGLIDR